MNDSSVHKGEIKQLTLFSLTFGAVLISFSGVWVKVANVAPNVSAFYRVFIGGVTLLAAALYRRELRWPGARHLLLSLLCGLLLALDLWLYHYSIRYIGPGLGTILPNFQVFILAAAGILILKEPVRLIYLISLPLAVVGLFMIVGINWSYLEPSYRMGIIYGLAAAVCYAGFLLSLRQLQADQMGTSFFYVLMTVSLTTAAFLGADIIYRQGSFQIPDLQSVLALLALGLTAMLPEEDQYTVSEQQFLDKICVALGGRVAEDVFLGKIGSGAYGDIKAVTNYARTMVTRLGSACFMTATPPPTIWPASSVILKNASRFAAKDGTSELPSGSTRAAGAWSTKPTGKNCR